MRQGKRGQTGTVLPICLLFLFLIAQLAMSAVETAALNQAMVANLNQTDDVNHVERLAFQQAFRHVSQQWSPAQDFFPLEVSMDVVLDGAGAEKLAPVYRFVYRIEEIEESVYAPDTHPWVDQCSHRHRIDAIVYGRSDTALRQNTKHHYLCCGDGSHCSDPELSVWIAAP